MALPTQEQIDAVEAKAFVDDEIVRQIMARVPPAWNLIKHLPNGGVFHRGGVQVLFTVQRYDNGNGIWDIWVHASLCGWTPSGGFVLPNWEAVKRVKHDFIGPDRWAYQVFPSAKDYINQNPYVLHLYAKLNGSPALPDFTWGLGGI
jgi:hypothetical protein